MTGIITTPLPFTFVNGEDADGTQVNANFNAIVADVNANAASIQFASGFGNVILQNNSVINNSTINNTTIVNPTISGGGNYGTPTIIVLTNATGTANGLTAGHVTNNADLTGPITSIGNTTSISGSINLPGDPTTTTQPSLDNSTKIATTAFVQNVILNETPRIAEITLSNITSDSSIIIPTNAIPLFFLLTYSISIDGGVAADGINITTLNNFYAGPIGPSSTGGNYLFQLPTGPTHFGGPDSNLLISAGNWNGGTASVTVYFSVL